MAYYYLPAFKFYSDAVRSGSSVGMTPGIFSGFPLALTQVGGYYDHVNYFLFSHWSWLTAYNMRIFINYFLAGFFTFLFARSLRMSFLASLVSMFAFITAQNIIPGANILRSNSFFLMPALFLALQHLSNIAVERRLLKTACWMIFMVCILTESVLGGYTQLVLYGLVAVTLYAVFLLHQRFSWSLCILFLTPFVVSLIIVLPYLSSVLELVPGSYRSEGLDWAIASAGVSFFNYILNISVYLFIPPFGMQTIQSVYIGSISVLFFVASLFHTQTRTASFFFKLLLIFSLVCTLPYPLFWIMHQLPVFDLFRFPPHWFFVTSFAISMLSGYGFDLVRSLSLDPAKSFAYFFASRIRSGIFVVLLSANFFIPTLFTVAYTSVSATVLFQEPWVLSEIKAFEAQLYNTQNTPQLFRTFQFFSSDTNALFLLGNVSIPTREQKDGVLKEYVQSHLAPLVWGIDSVRGFDNLESRRYTKVIEFLDKGHEGRDGPEGIQVTEDGYLANGSPTFALLGMMNVKYFWTSILIDPQLKGVHLLSNKHFDFGLSSFQFPIHLYFNDFFLPRVYAPFQATVMTESEDDSFKKVIEEPHNYAYDSYFECNECAKEVFVPTEKITIANIEFKNATTQFHTESNSDQWIVISNSNIPGWHAYIDGVETHIRFANYIYQGIFVPKGNHSVSLEFKEPF